MVTLSLMLPERFPQPVLLPVVFPLLLCLSLQLFPCAEILLVLQSYISDEYKQDSLSLPTRRKSQQKLVRKNTYRLT